MLIENGLRVTQRIQIAELVCWRIGVSKPSRSDSLTSGWLMKQIGCTLHSYLAAHRTTWVKGWMTEWVKWAKRAWDRTGDGNAGVRWECEWVAETNWRNECSGCRGQKRREVLDSCTGWKKQEASINKHTAHYKPPTTPPIPPCPKLPLLAIITAGQTRALSKKNLCSCKLLKYKQTITSSGCLGNMLVSSKPCHFPLFATVKNTTEKAKQ